MRRTLALSLLAALLATGCAHATIRKAESLDRNPPRSIVVMPTDPGMGPPEAAIHVRDSVTEALQRRGYQVIPFAEVDKRVDANASPAEVAAAIVADAILYTRVTRFGLTKDLFNTRTTFGLSFAMNDPEGGELWIAAWTVEADSVYQGPRSDDGVGAFVGAAIDVANAHETAKRPPFLETADAAIFKSIGELPEGPLAR